MGKTTGFMEYTRAEAPHRVPAARIQDYEEFLLPVSDEQIHLQSARCMDCGVPFCHAGMVVRGESVGCPLNNLIPETNDLLYRGDLDAACRRLAHTHPFPEITGRVCPALCEGSCTLGEHESPVTIKDIERYLADHGLQNGALGPRKTAPSTGRRVAAVGSGPAGLACADALSALGHEVAVYERADRAGGFLMYGIPNMKLDKRVVQSRVDILQKQGVRFVLNTEVGRDLHGSDLMRDYDAVVLCAGARSERVPDLPGIGAKGVHTAVTFLTGATKNLLDKKKPAGFVDAAGKDVVIVGGGDTGTDCVATCVRQGAASITQIEILPPPSEQRGEQNPWPLWPRVKTTGYGHEEAIEALGHDVREYETTLKEILTEKGRLTGVVTVKVAWRDGPGGRKSPVPIEGTEQTRPADLLLTAMGFTGPEELLVAQLGLAKTPRGSVQATEGDSTGAGGYRTNLATVFAAGDMRRGPSLVVWAILEGARAGRECHRYLQNIK